ncbi:MAG: hypothetical protein CMI06_11285 [Oceanospirillaceae bacterium]|nr:PilZ domain-containing protein [Thalassolituus sp. ST750PaO-4]MAY15907.1 hypothetical protein [Oceanospirillaceae bacterium]PIQ40600.1 MAG: hypothetical protein COW58_04990 [Thalassolituus sp. CG17_big_fil_post_rev_8_21_14_2_50_53_8]
MTSSLCRKAFPPSSNQSPGGNVQANERRFRQRYDASPLKLEIRMLNLFGRPKKAHMAIARDFAIGGIAIISPLKMKVGKRLLISIESRDHRLQAIPAVIIRAEASGGDYLYALKFAMGQLPEVASRGAYTVLQRLEVSLKSVSPA